MNWDSSPEVAGKGHWTLSIGSARSKTCDALHSLAGLDPARKIGPDAVDAKRLAKVWEAHVIVWECACTDGTDLSVYQVDRFRFVRDIRRIFGKDSESYQEIASMMDVDPTGRSLMQTLVECRVHSSGKKREELDALISDLSTIPDSVCDYRVRLRAMGIDTTGLRALGAAESEVNRVSNRTKKQGRSWRPYGLSGIMPVQRAKLSRNLDTVLKRLPEASKFPMATEEEVDEVAAKAIRKVFDSYSRDTGFHPPIMDRGRTASGGMSALFHQLLNGAQFPA